MSALLPHIPSPREARRFRVSYSQSRHPPTAYLSTLWEVGIVSLAIFLYFFVRGLMDSKVSLAEEHARWLVNLEQRLGIFHEPDLQGWVLTHDWLVWLANAIYMYGHWPIVISTLIWLLWRRSDEFPVYRSAFLISAAIGLLVFATFPMAPPRMFPNLGFIDTVTVHSEDYRAMQPTAFSNEYAAMPSLHVGWNLLMGIAIFRTTTHLFWRAFGVVMPLAMYLTTILTANHLIIDGIVGSLVAVVSVMIAIRINAWRRGSQAQADASPPRTLMRDHVSQRRRHGTS